MEAGVLLTPCGGHAGCTNAHPSPRLRPPSRTAPRRCRFPHGQLVVEAYERPVPSAESGTCVALARCSDDAASKTHWVGFARSLVHGLAGTSAPKVRSAAALCAEGVH
jgi:hypothetical protein